MSETKARIVEAAVTLVRGGGFSAATVGAIAGRAGIAAGTVYRHFPSKAELCAEVFRIASGHELRAVEDALAGPGSPSQRLARAVETFAGRALAGRRLAYALLAEPVAPLVEAERLAARRAYARLFAGVLGEGIAVGEFAPQRPAVSAAAIVGVVAETLVGPLADGAARDGDRDGATLIGEIGAFCLRAVAATAAPAGAVQKQSGERSDERQGDRGALGHA